MSCPHQVFMKTIYPADLKMMRVQGACNNCDKKGADLWACLQDCCSYIGCGKCNRNHIELHNQETDHHLCINLNDYKIWCFSCKSSVDPSNEPNSPGEMPAPGEREMTINYRYRSHDLLDDDDFLHLEQGLKPRGLCGLVNIGNTCYMNAALQALSNCPPLAQFFLECTAMINENKHPGLSKHFYNLINELWSRKRPKYIAPSQFLRSVRLVNSQFRGYGQQDAQEFLRCIMDRLHEELKQPIMSYSRMSCDTSDESDEPSHQAKRLLGGTCAQAQHRHGDDFEMSCESGDEDCNSSNQDSEMPLERRKSFVVLGTPDVQIDIEMENEEPATEKTERLITNSYSNGKCNQSAQSANNDIDSRSSFSDKKPESAAHTTGGKNTSGSERHCHEDCPADSPAEVIKKTSTYHSIITDLFDGQVQSSVQCLTCNRISFKIETFQDLSLPIPGKDELNVIHAAQCSPLASRSIRDDLSSDHKGWMMSILDWVRRWFYGPQVTLQDCLSAFFSADELKGDNMYSCEKCKKLRNGIKLCKVLHLPEILCVHLKRFRHEMYFSSKISHFISFPMTSLNMKPFLVRDYRSNTSHKPSTSYDLVAVISHHGSVGAGHYVAFAKNYISNKWYEFNDSWVSEVPESYISSVEAYVLFYRKTSEIASQERQLLFGMMQSSESCVRCFYVSKLWFLKFQTCAEPGPITNTDFVCQHGGIHPKSHRRIKDFVTAVPEVVWTHMYNRYGGGPVVTCLDICEECEILIEQMDKRRDQEFENFKKLNQQYPPAENVDVYCISMKWFRLWEAFVKGQEEDPPGPIENRNIVAIKGNSRILKTNADYGQVAVETWDYLHGIYGGGPIFVLEAEAEEQEV